MNELWRRIRGLAKVEAEAEYRRARAGDVRDSLAALDKIRRVLSYEPVVDLDEGLQRTVEFDGGLAKLKRHTEGTDWVLREAQAKIGEQTMELELVEMRLEKKIS